MKENKIEKLAKISSRAQLEDEIKWSNSTYYLRNITFLKLLCFFFAYFFTQNRLFSGFIIQLTRMINRNKINIFPNLGYFRDVEILLDISLLSLLWFAVNKMHDYYLASNPGYIRVDCFSHDMLEEECDAIRKKLVYQEKHFCWYQIVSTSLEVYFLASNHMSIYPSVKKLIFAKNITQAGTIVTAISRIGYFVLQAKRVGQPSEVCTLINKIFANSNISFSLYKDKDNDNHLEVDHILFSFIKPNILIKTTFAFKVTKFPIKFISNFEKYYLMILIKKNIEEHLNLEVPAIDDDSFLIKLSNVYKKDFAKLLSKEKIINNNMTIFLSALNKANRKINSLNAIASKYTDKSWKKIFNLNDANFFSFSLTIKSISNPKLRNNLEMEIKEIYSQANIYTFATKLVIEGNVIKQNNNQNQMSVSRSSKSLITDMEQNYNVPISKNKNSMKIKIKHPKIFGLHRYLFLKFKQPILNSIRWSKENSPSLNASSYFPISHACTNKIIFYSVFTLPADCFTAELSKEAYLSILKTQILKSNESTGSCIKFITHDERENLKQKIQHYVNSDDVIFKLHARNNTRVLGILKDTGVAKFDDGTEVKVKLIDFCIVDHESHKKNSTKIHFSNQNSNDSTARPLTIK